MQSIIHSLGYGPGWAPGGLVTSLVITSPLAGPARRMAAGLRPGLLTYEDGGKPNHIY